MDKGHGRTKKGGVTVRHTRPVILKVIHAQSSKAVQDHYSKEQSVSAALYIPKRLTLGLPRRVGIIERTLPLSEELQAVFTCHLVGGIEKIAALLENALQHQNSLCWD